MNQKQQILSLQQAAVSMATSPAIHHPLLAGGTKGVMAMVIKNECTNDGFHRCDCDDCISRRAKLTHQFHLKAAREFKRFGSPKENDALMAYSKTSGYPMDRVEKIFFHYCNGMNIDTAIVQVNIELAGEPS